MDTDTIIDLAEAYTAHTGLKLSTVSTYAAGDGKKFKYLKNGGGCTLRVAARVVGWFEQNWPADLAWPKHIARPSERARTKRRAA